jgi:hypothetical protein
MFDRVCASFVGVTGSGSGSGSTTGTIGAGGGRCFCAVSARSAQQHRLRHRA